MCDTPDSRPFNDRERLIEKVVDDLVQMHNDTAIELEYWEPARMLVEKYYKVSTTVKIGRKLTDVEKKRGY